MKDRSLFAFAGLWDRWEHHGNAIESCTFCTTDANELTQTIHDRMPVVLPRDQYALWLDPANDDAAALKSLLRPFPSEQMEMYPCRSFAKPPDDRSPQWIEPRVEPVLKMKMLFD